MNLMEEFVFDGRVQGWTERTIQAYCSNLKVFFNFIQKDLKDVDSTDLEKFLLYLDEDRQVSNSTIKKYFDVISSFYTYLEFEGLIPRNPVTKFRRRYLKCRMKNMNPRNKRQVISISQMRDLINSILDPKDKAIVVALAKTGVRLSELVNIDVSDVDWTKQSIILKPNGKRSNLLVFFDDECGRILRRYMRIRNNLAKPGEEALFVSYYGERMKLRPIEDMVRKYAEKINLHDPSSDDLQKRFTPHHCRHWFSKHLSKTEMDKDFLKELRGDSRNETVDGYIPIDEDELRESYLACIPQLGI